MSHAEVSRSQQIRAEVFRLLNDGIHAYKEGRYKDAIPLLEQAADIALNSFRAYYYLGLSLKADRRYLMAIEPLTIALELDPVSLQARVALGDCYLLRGDPAEALAEYHRALSLQDDYAPAFDGLGRTAEAGGDTERAIEHFRRAIDLNPGFPDPALNLGDLYMREGRNTEAIGLFLSAIRVRPDFAAAYNRLGVAYARLKQSNQAIAALRHAQTLEQGNAWHPVTIGRIFMELNSLIQAERECDRALEIDPDYLGGYIAEATLLRRLGRLDEAVGILEEGAMRDVEAPREQAQIQDLLDTITEESSQLAILEEALASNGRKPDDLIAIARLKSRQGNHTAAAGFLIEARDVMNGVIAVDPNAAPEAEAEADAVEPAAGEGGAGNGVEDTVANEVEGDAPAGTEPVTAITEEQLLGLICYDALKGEMYEAAASACEDLLEASGPSTNHLINLALARVGMADHDGAIEALREANRLRPGDPVPLAYLGNVYLLSRRRPEAVESLTASLSLMSEDQTERQQVERLLEILVPENPVPAEGAP